MIGISQLQDSSKKSGRLRSFAYISVVQALSMVTMPTSIIVSLVSSLYDAEINTFLAYKKIKDKEKISKKEYWKIFVQGNIIKSTLVSCLAALAIYCFFSKFFILAWILAPISLAVGVVLLQPETRPAKLNPVVLLKASLKLLSEGLYENLIGMKNVINAMQEHRMPHLANDSIDESIAILRNRYGSDISVPERVKDDNLTTDLIKHIQCSTKSTNDKAELIDFINKLCDDIQQIHASSGLTGGQILHLILKACDNGDVSAKREELLKSLSYALNYAKGTAIPETCFTGVIGAMLKSLEGIEEGVHIHYEMEERMGSHVEGAACH